MAIDPYSPCPGGTGKKIKFCCTDLPNDLEKIDRMLTGEQYAGALEQVERLEQSHSHRACLLATKIELQMAQQQYDRARETIAEFLLYHPTNPVALANDAMMLAMAGEQQQAVDQLQAALESGGADIMPRVYEALGVVGQMLLVKERLPAALAHFTLQARLGGETDRRALSVIMRLNQTSACPLLFKETRELASAPEGVSWRAKFDEACEHGRHANWRRAEQQFAALLPEAENSAPLWRNLALVRSWLGDNAGAAAAWRRYAKFAETEISRDDAVEAEATAQLLEPDPVGDPIEVLHLEYPVTDFDALEARLLADKRLSRVPFDSAAMAAEGTPPPRAIYSLLDRPQPSRGAELTLEQLPRNLGRIYLFGKETDRAARLVFEVERDARLEAAKETLLNVAAGTLGAMAQEEVIEHVSAMQHALSLRFGIPDGLSREAQAKLILEIHRETLLKVWPATPMRLFGGQTPAAAAADPANTIPLLAAILNLELSSIELEQPNVYSEMRAVLGLPRSEPFDCQNGDVGQIPLARLHRLNPGSLDNAQLAIAFNRVHMAGESAAAYKLAKAIIGRDGFDPLLRHDAYRELARMERDPRQAIAYIDAGRKETEQRGFSSAAWDLQELAFHLEQGNFPEVSRLIDHVAREHRQEPGVAQALYQLMYEAGLVGADGQLRVPAAAPAAAPPSSEIWTPGGTQPQGEKQKLWMPGME
ncbi:MAG TPA: hypothetical protein VFE24_10615 [Pirellulales bacterium]|jgi:tetratricopeptide (TPR) repeat protein|nr:hypothetical protein [Pirellulales bacterium]